MIFIKLMLELKVSPIGAPVMLAHVRLLFVALCCKIELSIQHVQGQRGLKERMRFNELLLPATDPMA